MDTVPKPAAPDPMRLLADLLTTKYPPAPDWDSAHLRLTTREVFDRLLPHFQQEVFTLPAVYQVLLDSQYLLADPYGTMEPRWLFSLA